MNDFIELVKLHALEYGKFTLNSGAESHFYLDVRKLTLSPDNVKVASAIHQALQEFEGYTALGGPESGANQIVGSYMTFLGLMKLPYCTGFTVRKKEKGHGKDGLIVGNLKKNDRAVLVEDVTTTGASLMNAIKAVRDFGANVIAVITIVDRQEGACQLIEGEGIQFRSLVKLSDIEIIDWQHKNK